MTAASRGKRNRAKGHEYERHVAHLLAEIYPDARRGIQSQDARAADVEGTPFRVECKCGKSPQLRKAWEQARDDGVRHDDHRPPVVFAHWHRAGYHTDLAVIAVDDLLDVVEKLEHRRSVHQPLVGQHPDDQVRDLLRSIISACEHAGRDDNGRLCINAHELAERCLRLTRERDALRETDE